MPFISMVKGQSLPRAEACENIHAPQPFQLGCPGREEAITPNTLHAPNCHGHVSRPFIDKPRFCSSVLFPKQARAGLFPQAWQGLLGSEALSPLEKTHCQTCVRSLVQLMHRNTRGEHTSFETEFEET